MYLAPCICGSIKGSVQNEVWTIKRHLPGLEIKSFIHGHIQHVINEVHAQDLKQGRSSGVDKHDDTPLKVWKPDHHRAKCDQTVVCQLAPCSPITKTSHSPPIVRDHPLSSIGIHAPTKSVGQNPIVWFKATLLDYPRPDDFVMHFLAQRW